MDEPCFKLPSSAGRGKRLAGAGLAALLLATLLVYLYEIRQRDWYADDYGRVRLFGRNDLSGSLGRWFESENGRLDVLVQYALHLLRTPFRVHLATLALHLANVALLFLLAGRLLGWETAWAPALVFALHPQGCRAVLWASNACYLVSCMACLAAANLALVNGKSFWRARLLGALVLALGLSVHEQGVLLAPLLALLGLRAGDFLRPRPWIGAFFYGLSAVFAVALQRILSPVGKAHMLSLENLPAKAALQLGQALVRSVSPGLRTSVIPLLKGEIPIDPSFAVLWILTPPLIAAGVFASLQAGPGEAAAHRKGKDLLFLAALGLSIFLAGFLVGAFALHPYLVKRMFYIPSLGWSLSAGAILALAARGLPSPGLRKAVLVLAGALFTAVAAPVVMLNIRHFSEGTRLQRAAEEALHAYKGKPESGTPEVYLLGMDHDGVYLPPARLGPDPEQPPSPGSLVLSYREGRLERIGRIFLRTVGDGAREILLSPEADAGMDFVQGRFRARGADRPLARIGPDLRLVGLDLMLARQSHVALALTFEAPEEMLLHRVYPRAEALHENGARTPGPDTRRPAKRLGPGEAASFAAKSGLQGGLYRHVLQWTLPQDSPVVGLRIGFETVAADPALGRIQKVGGGFVQKGNALYLDLSSDQAGAADEP
ncbi:MAG: hypothetical protein V1918_04840 [Planctomycetota bacterium]